MNVNGRAKEVWAKLLERAAEDGNILTPTHLEVGDQHAYYTFDVTSASDPENVRHVTLSVDFNRRVDATCTCDAHKYGKLCRHIAMAVHYQPVYSYLTERQSPIGFIPRVR